MKFFPLIFLLTLLPLSAQKYEPLTAKERLAWFANSSYGPRSLFYSGPITSAWRTYRNRPEEWGPHWEGFGKRYGARLVNNSITNGLEGTTGAIWKEDPRYFRLGQGPIRQRILQAVTQTWNSRYGDGKYRFGAARAIGLVGSSFGQKLWMPNSVTSNSDCFVRVGSGYMGNLMGNLFREFKPELMKMLKRKKT